MESENEAIVGIGWSFPPRFNRDLGEVEMVTGEQEIKESLKILFATQKGERVLNAEFGCSLSEMVLRSVSLTERSEFEERLRTAILNFEPRIIVHELRLETDDAREGELKVFVDFSISSTNTRSNVVFPFYLQEGTLVSKP